jgi:Tol biopolymer transport system component
MHRSKIVVLSLTGLALLAAAAGSVAASPAKAPWKITLSSDREGDSAIYSMNADGSGVRRLLRSKTAVGPGPWSPDGRKLLYNRNPGDVWVMKADGSGRRNLTRNAAFDCCGTWSPDGRKIAFTSNRDGNNELYVMNADGSGQRNLAPAPSSQEFSGGWSPDGRTILFTTDRDGNEEIYAMNVDGSNPRNLTRHPLNDGRDGGFSWSPDGRKIVFATNRDRIRGSDGKVSTELYVMNADGSAQQRLTRTPEFEFVSSWSPDGRRIAFGRFPAKPRWSFFVMNADGSGVRKVTWSLPGKR